MPPPTESIDPATDPIPPARFALALESLDIPTLHAKTAEIRNAQRHLRASNAELEQYLAEEAQTSNGEHDASGDDELRKAVTENEVVIERMEGRVLLLKAEVERRGALWVDADDSTTATTPATAVAAAGAGGEEETREHVERGVNSMPNAPINGAVHGQAAAPSGRLTDAQLAARMAERMNNDLDDEDEGGLHL